jgi:hypothetical protein
MQRLRLYLLAAGFVGLALLALTPTARVKADDDQDGGIVGTWIGSLSLNGSSIVITELPSFGGGGTVRGTNTFSHNIPAARTYGRAKRLFRSWAPIAGSSQIAITLKRLIFACPNTPVANYGQSFPGQNVGIVSIQAVGTVQHTENGDTLTDPVTFQLTNLLDQVVFAGSGTASFTRVAIEPLNAGDPTLNGIGSDPNTKMCLSPGAHCNQKSDYCSGVRVSKYGTGKSLSCAPDLPRRRVLCRGLPEPRESLLGSQGADSNQLPAG